MNKELNDPILNALTGVTPYPEAHLDASQLNSNDKLTANVQPTTLKEFLSEHEQHAEILALVSAKQNELSLANTQVTDNQNDLAR